MHINDLRKLKRFKDIVTILAKYGFDDIVTRLDVPGSDLLRKMHQSETDMEPHERIRAVVEDLGPTFIKFGQIMSLRPDLLPPDILKELEKLQDNVPPDDFNEIEVLIEKELGKPIQQIFSTFEITPMAAASISQVHKATLRHEDTAVAVKAQRPHIEKNIKLDLDILEGIANFLDQQFEDLRSYELPDLVRIIRKNLMKELDFTKELRSMDIARSNATDQDFYVPRTYGKYSSTKVLIMELIEGTKLKDLQTTSGYDREKIAVMGLRAGVKQILEDGFFHADPHPGNIFLLPGNRLCFIDCGMTGQLDKKTTDLLIDLVAGIIRGNLDKLTRVVLELTDASPSMISRKDFRFELQHLVNQVQQSNLERFDISTLLQDFFTMLRRFRIQCPSDLLLLTKSLTVIESVAEQFDPTFDVLGHVEPQIRELISQRYSYKALRDRMMKSLGSYLALLEGVPQDVQRFLDNIRRSNFTLNLELERIEHLASKIDLASRVMGLAMIISALIVGSSILILADNISREHGFLGNIGLIGLILAGIYSASFVISFLLPKKKK